MDKTEKNLEDILNAGIAIFRSTEKSFKAMTAELKKSFNELKEKGAADTSKEAEAARKMVEELTEKIENLESTTKTAYSEALKNFETTAKSIQEQVTRVVPAEKISRIQERVDELLDAIRARLKESQKEEPKQE